MYDDKKLMNLEAWFDGEPCDERAAELLLANDAEAQRHLQSLERIRAEISILRAAAPAIEDADFGRFMAGISREVREAAPALAPSRPSRRPLWAVASLAAASILLALSTLYIFSGGPQPVQASVEMVNTEIAGARTGSEVDQNGNAIVWIDLAEDDL